MHCIQSFGTVTEIIFDIGPWEMGAQETYDKFI